MRLDCGTPVMAIGSVTITGLQVEVVSAGGVVPTKLKTWGEVKRFYR